MGNRVKPEVSSVRNQWRSRRVFPTYIQYMETNEAYIETCNEH